MGKKGPDRRSGQLPGQKAPQKGRGKEKKRRPIIKPRPPFTAVVSVTIKPGVEFVYRNVMRKARSMIDFKALGIVDSRIKQAATGGILIQIPGKDREKMADDLANRMDEIFKKEGVLIGCPSRLVELRVWGIDISVSPNDIVEAVASTGKCAEDIKIGQMRYTPSGQGLVWVKCPVRAAKRVAESGRIRMGWGRAMIEPLRPRPLTC